MAKLAVALLTKEAELAGEDIVDLLATVVATADMARDETIDLRRRELALEIGCATVDLIELLNQRAIKRQRAQGRRQSAKEAA